MDTVISNKYSDVFNSLDIEVSKRLKGVKIMVEKKKNFKTISIFCLYTNC